MHAEVIVIGLGSMGSAACHFLTQAGLQVIGLEQFSIPHDKGSHHGQSRIIRKAYFEHPDYVPLLNRAYQLWKDLEARTGSTVFLRTGLLYMGRASHPSLRGTRDSARTHQVAIENLHPDALSRKYPQVNLPQDYEAIFEPDAGLLTPERAITGYTRLAQASGATICTNTSVIHWRKESGQYRVTTNQGDFTAEKLVITAGAYTQPLVPAWKAQLQVTRQVVAWVNMRNPELFAPDRWPCWTISEDDLPGIYYGFPILPRGQFDGPAGFKLAHHAPGTPCDPHQVSRAITEADESAILTVLERYFPGQYRSTELMKTCLYTMTPDEHFIVDFLPGHEPDVAIAAGFSGHGFKFASAIGAILSELVTRGRSTSPIGFLSAQRTALHPD